jgi:hypothetical protein
MVSGIFAALFSNAPKTTTETFFDFKHELDANREPHDFAQHKGKVVVVANVASY